MRGRKRSFVVELSPAERADLERWQRSTTVSVGLARRARVLLLLADGRSLKETASVAGLTVRILQRKRLAIADFADKAELAERLQAYIQEWNEVAHPFKWSTKSVTKIMAKCGQPLPKDTSVAQAA